MTSVVRISAPSRLHFGLLRFSCPEGSSYGGLGMTIDSPRTVVQLQASSEWHAEGPLAERALAFAKLAMRSCRPEQSDAISLRICQAPPPHCGLGAGTQLALAVARGIREIWQLPTGSAAELAASVDRGKRSAVGSHGFLQGGLIWETGRRSKDSLGTLARRIAVPSHWRVLLLSQPQKSGLYGDREVTAFERLPSVPPQVTDKLQRLAEESILPAAEEADFEIFAEAIHDYGRLAGSCFATVQGGSFASPEIGQLVDRLRKLGIDGVGQSSWGPTVFALAAGEDQAAEFVDRVQALRRGTTIAVVAPDNLGALVEKIAPNPEGSAI